MRIHAVGALIALAMLTKTSANADVLIFEDDYAGFMEAAGSVSTIDFETMPDGQPTRVGVELTESFNYDEQGVHFSSPFPYPFFAGNPQTGFGIRTVENEHTWIIADLVLSTQAVGAFFPGATELCVFDENGSEIACHFFSDPGEDNFLGMVSDVPIVSATFDTGTSSETVDSFIFSPVPEPGTCILVASGLAFVARRRRRN